MSDFVDRAAAAYIDLSTGEFIAACALIAALLFLSIGSNEMLRRCKNHRQTGDSNG